MAALAYLIAMVVMMLTAVSYGRIREGPDNPVDLRVSNRGEIVGHDHRIRQQA